MISCSFFLHPSNSDLSPPFWFTVLQPHLLSFCFSNMLANQCVYSLFILFGMFHTSSSQAPQVGGLLLIILGPCKILTILFLATSAKVPHLFVFTTLHLIVLFYLCDI